MNDFRFLTEEQVNNIDILIQRRTFAPITDFSILLGGFCSDENYYNHSGNLEDRTGIYWTDDADREVVTEVFGEIQKHFQEPLVVEKAQLQSFYPAEEYHQDYLLKNPEGYCHLPLSLIRQAKKYQQSLLEIVE